MIEAVANATGALNDDIRTVIFYEPHHDDIALFCAYSLMTFAREAFVRTVLGMTDHPTRGSESRAAMDVLGVRAEGYESWPVYENEPDWAEVHTRMSMDKYEVRRGKLIVFAPAVEEGGHEHHNSVGRLAQEIFGDVCVSYLTYRRGFGRSKSDTEVVPAEREHGWRAKKMTALACYASQIDRADTRPWFASDEIFQEWLL